MEDDFKVCHYLKRRESLYLWSARCIGIIGAYKCVSWLVNFILSFIMTQADTISNPEIANSNLETAVSLVTTLDNFSIAFIFAQAVTFVLVKLLSCVILQKHCPFLLSRFKGWLYGRKRDPKMLQRSKYKDMVSLHELLGKVKSD